VASAEVERKEAEGEGVLMFLALLAACLTVQCAFAFAPPQPGPAPKSALQDRLPRTCACLAYRTRTIADETLLPMPSVQHTLPSPVITKD
jgi:hypothetical protein